MLPVLFVAASGISPLTAPAATIRIVPTEDAKVESTAALAHVEVTGQIDRDSPSSLKAALELAKKRSDLRTLGGAPAIHVYLHSPGGNVLAAMAMGSLLRTYGAEAWIRPQAVCASACVLVLAGGVDRLAFDRAKIVIHRPRFESSLFAGLQQSQAQAKYTAMANQVRDYLSAMGISERLFQRMMQVPSQDAFELSEETAKDMNLLGQDPAFAEWDRARASERYRPEFLEWNDCLLKGGDERRCAKILDQAQQK